MRTCVYAYVCVHANTTNTTDTPNEFFLRLCIGVLVIMTAIILVLIIILVALIYSTERFRSCRDCEGGVAANGTIVVNPFIWPYSGTQCVDELYALNKDSGVDIGTKRGPLTHLNTPDHVILTN